MGPRVHPSHFTKETAQVPSGRDHSPKGGLEQSPRGTRVSGSRPFAPRTPCSVPLVPLSLQECCASGQHERWPLLHLQFEALAVQRDCGVDACVSRTCAGRLEVHPLLKQPVDLYRSPSVCKTHARSCRGSKEALPALHRTRDTRPTAWGTIAFFPVKKEVP